VIIFTRIHPLLSNAVSSHIVARSGILAHDLPEKSSDFLTDHHHLFMNLQLHELLPNQKMTYQIIKSLTT